MRAPADSKPHHASGALFRRRPVRAYSQPARVDIAHSTNMPITLVFLPAADIAAYVGEGNVDMGITGQDIIAETRAEVIVHQVIFGSGGAARRLTSCVLRRNLALGNAGLLCRLQWCRISPTRSSFLASE